MVALFVVLRDHIVVVEEGCVAVVVEDHIVEDGCVVAVVSDDTAAAVAVAVHVVVAVALFAPGSAVMVVVLVEQSADSCWMLAVCVADCRAVVCSSCSPKFEQASQNAQSTRCFVLCVHRFCGHQNRARNTIL